MALPFLVWQTVSPLEARDPGPQRKASGLKARPSIEKRRKEKARLDKNREKAEKRAQKRVDKADRPDADPDEDPDIAGIVPGPQPLPPEFGDLPTGE